MGIDGKEEAVVIHDVSFRVDPEVAAAASEATAKVVSIFLNGSLDEAHCLLEQAMKINRLSEAVDALRRVVMTPPGPYGPILDSRPPRVK